VGENHPGKFLRSFLVRQPLVEPLVAPVLKHSDEAIPTTRLFAARRSPVQPKPATLEIAEPAATKEVAAVNVSSAPPAPAVSKPAGSGEETGRQTAATKEVAVVNASLAPPAPVTFKPIGYVEKAGGQLEAIILQESELQVVHTGDLIAGRYRVTKITPDSVDAIDETLVRSPMAKPDGAESKELTASVAPPPSTPPGTVAPVPPEVLTNAGAGEHPANIQGAEPVSAAPAVTAQAQSVRSPSGEAEARITPPQGVELAENSLGYVQRANGKVESVVADGDTVRLVPETPAVTMAQVSPARNTQEGGSPAQGSTEPAPAVSSTVEAVADHSIHSRVLPDASAIRQASYLVPTPAAEASASVQLSMDSAGGPAGAANVASEPAITTFTAKTAGSGDRLSKLPVEVKTLGFVVKADGEFAAILSQDDEVYVVRQGDRFAGRYRAVSVSADAVEAVEEPPRQAFPSPFALPYADLLSAAAQPGLPPFSRNDCSGCKSDELGELTAKLPDDPGAEVASPPPRKRKQEQMRAPLAKGLRQSYPSASKETASPPDPATLIFQTLGYVETQDGAIQAVVADGSSLYLVKQGETFADQYLATSVDPGLVLAVRVSPGQEAGNSLSAQTESGGKPASKRLYGYLHYSLAGLANAQAFYEVDASGGPVLLDLGVNLLKSPLGSGKF
jgi:Tfp pilus assembly protein PilP